GLTPGPDPPASSAPRPAGGPASAARCLPTPAQQRHSLPSATTPRSQPPPPPSRPPRPPGRPRPAPAAGPAHQAAAAAAPAPGSSARPGSPPPSPHTLTRHAGNSPNYGTCPESSEPFAIMRVGDAEAGSTAQMGQALRKRWVRTALSGAGV